jgi:hypothetical protein
VISTWDFGIAANQAAWQVAVARRHSAKKYPANAPRPPGGEHWLILDLKSRVVDFISALG